MRARTRFSHQLVVGSVYITVHVRPSRLTAPQRPTGNARRCPRTLRATSRLRDANRGSVVLRSVTNPGPAAGATASGGSAAPLVSRVYARTKLSNVRDRSTRTKFLEQLSGFADSAVGISLLAIGLIGVKESLASNDDTEKVVDTEDSSMYYVPPTGRGISLVTTVLEMINFDSNLYRTQ